MLTADQCALVIIDVQGKLAQLMYEREQLVTQLTRLVRGAQLYSIPVLWMEQLPEKLGPTIDELQALLAGHRPMSKSSFGCYGDPGFREALHSTGRETVLLCGIESHVCVYQTAAKLLESRFKVHTVEDAISSRTAANRQLGLDRMRVLGAIPTSVEMLFFEMQQQASGPLFREMARLFR